jgi:hypothetical protein
LRFAAVIPSSAGFEYGTGVLLELGLEYIFVSGQCDYVVWIESRPAVAPFYSWSPIRQGALTEEMATELAIDFDYGNWAANSGRWFGPDYNISDAPTLLMHDGTNKVVCLKPCEESAPPLGHALEVAMTEWPERLYVAGTDLDGAMRLRVFEMDPVPPNATLFAWSLVAPPEDLLGVGDPTRIDGPAHVIEDEQELDALRAMRPDLANRVIPTAGWGAMSAHPDPQRVYVYAFRDITPFENEDGVIPEFAPSQ